MGNPIIFCILCLSVIGLPVAFIYLLNGTLTIVTEVDEPEEFVKQYRNRY
jgi:hypothetical protein